MQFDERTKLYKYDPVEDAEKTFDINLALNQNWDKITAQLEKTVMEYNTEYDYAAGDMVQSGGMLYVSLQNGNTGNTPETATDWWRSYAGSGTYWTGTRVEYDAARAEGEIDDDTICYITDDDGIDDRIKTAIEEEVKKYNGGGGGIAPSNVVDKKIKVGNGEITIWWSDPGDTIIDGQTVCTWKGTKLVQKVGASPENINDGTLVVDNQVKNKYKIDGFKINGLTNGKTYYFALFTYSDTGAVNKNHTNRLDGTPQPFKTMTVKIDLANSNPATCCTYTDDAAGMDPGSAAWDEFFGHYPVLFKDGAEVGRLNPDDFTKFADGTAADITSGAAGDVMIAFPRRGLKIETVGDIVTVSMTDDPDAEGFEYLAHTRGSERREKFYLGAYKGYTASSKLRSLSGKTPTAPQTIRTFRTQAQANGSGYEQSGFYQLTFRQAMYILKCKNLDSQTAVGRGYVDGNSAAIATGGTETRGMDWGETTGKQHMKLFGLEDFWGNVYEWIDGIVTDSTRNILTATDKFNDTGSGYTNRGQGATSNIGNYMSKPQGTTETGFLAKEVSGSATTYFCDYATLSASCVARFGGTWSNGSIAGAFLLDVAYAASGSSAYIAARLMYL